MSFQGSSSNHRKTNINNSETPEKLRERKDKWKNKGSKVQGTRWKPPRRAAELGKQRDECVHSRQGFENTVSQKEEEKG